MNVPLTLNQKLQQAQDKRFTTALNILLTLTLTGFGLQGIIFLSGAPLVNGWLGVLGNALVLAALGLSKLIVVRGHIAVAKQVLFVGLGLYQVYISFMLGTLDALLFVPAGAALLSTSAFLVQRRTQATKTASVVVILAAIAMLSRAFTAPPLPDHPKTIYLIYIGFTFSLLGIALFFNSTLSKDLSEALIDSEQARTLAHEASQAKSSFLANMSHELRTPLNAIIGYAELMREDLEERDPEAESLEDISRIHTSAQHLLLLISDILDLAKIEAGKMDLHIETFSLDDLIQELYTIGLPLAQKRNNALAIDREATPKGQRLHTDRTKLRQILLNLLSNSAKFTTSGKLTLRFSLSPQDELIIDVEDTGIGMDQAQLDRVFEAFEQARLDTATKYGGTGLGLTITRHLCTLLGATLRVKSELEQGTTFTIELPAQALVKQENKPASSDAA